MTIGGKNTLNRIVNGAVLALLALAAIVGPLQARDKEREQLPQILIANVDVFDGRSDTLARGMNVLIEGNLIKQVGKGLGAREGASVIDASGKVMIPGLIEAHQHLALVEHFMQIRNEYDWMYVGGAAAKRANDMLLRGFTTVRDLGGPVFGLARLINEGRVPGPRIYPSGAMISQTSGHGDFRNYNDPHPVMFGPKHFNDMYWTFIVDGVDAVTRATRENLRNGATQIKVMAGGGVSSTYDPLDAIQYTMAELEAAVEAAENWHTYVAVHAYKPDSVQRALQAGVKCIDHGVFIDEPTMQMLKERGAFLVPQLQVLALPDEAVAAMSPASQKKFYEAKTANETMWRLAAKHDVKVGFGTDLFGPEANFIQQNLEFGARLAFFSSLEILKQATSVNAELIALSGPRNPFQDGPLGVIEEGAYADLLVVDGNPLEDIRVLEDPDRNLKVIMKDGVIHKNTL